MDANTALSIAVLIVIGVALTVVAATEAGIVTVSRARARLLTERGERRGEALLDQTRQRAVTYTTFTVVRIILVIAGAMLLASLILDAFDSRWLALLVAGLVAICVTLVIQVGAQFLILQSAEPRALELVPLANVIRVVFGPFAWVFSLPARAWMRLRGIQAGAPDEVSEAEELLRLVEIEHGGGPIEEEEAQMIRGVIGLEGTTVREVMVPRIDMVAIEAGATLQQAVEIIVSKGVSRLPMYRGSADSIIGILYAKDLLRFFADGTAPASLEQIARPAYFIPESKKTDDLLREMRQNKVHIAIVVDEYGGTAGLVTIEDLIEEIVGEIEDEYDTAPAAIQRISDDEAIVDARVSVDEVSELFETDLEQGDFDTIGGLVYTMLGKIPSVGDEVRVDGLLVHIDSVNGHRIAKVHIARLIEPPEQNDSPANAEARAS